MIRLLGCALVLVAMGCDSDPTGFQFKEAPGSTPACESVIVANDSPRRGAPVLDTIPCGRPPTQ